MEKKKSWFNLVKRLFIWETHSTQEMKEKRRKWIFGKLKKHSESAVTAIEVVNVILSGISQDNSEESEPFKIMNSVSQSIYKCQKEIQEFAAIKIQTAFRSYLAKKALRALKGMMKLQAIIRGRAVRRQAMSTLKSLQSIVSIQSKICARMHYSKDKIFKMDSNSERKWDDSTLLKEEEDASCMIEKEAIIKKE